MRARRALPLLALLAIVAVPPGGRGQTHDGYRLPPDWAPPVNDRTINRFVLLEKFEFRTGQAADAVIFDAQGWLGGDFHRFWWKAEGEQERLSPKTGEFDVQALYGRLFRPFWDFQAGVRLDRRYSGRERDTRGHLALGVQGVAPYWFELEPTLFLSDKGDVTFSLEASYEQLITQRWVIEPRLDLDAAFQDEPRRDIGAGLGQVEFGLRLRYEFTRQIAPYVGVTWRRAIGETAGLKRRSGENVSEAAVVMGLRTWF